MVPTRYPVFLVIGVMMQFVTPASAVAQEVPAETASRFAALADAKNQEQLRSLPPLSPDETRALVAEAKQHAGCPPRVYPAEARRAGQTGRVELQFMIGTDGTIAGMRIKRSSGFALLDQSAMETLSKCRLVPHLKNDVISFDWLDVAYVFDLP